MSDKITKKVQSVYFLVNSLVEFDFSESLTELFSDVNCVVGEIFPKHPNDYDLVVLWSFRKILKGLESYNNIVLCHSSDLPEGKGFAPIYNCLVSNKSEYVISCIKAVDEVDTGNIIGQARFKILSSYTASKLRAWDIKISLMILKKVLVLGIDNCLHRKQLGEESFYPRKRPKDNKIDVNKPFREIVQHLKASEPKKHPAYFYCGKEKFMVDIYPEQEPLFPTDLTITVVACDSP